MFDPATWSSKPCARCATTGSGRCQMNRSAVAGVAADVRSGSKADIERLDPMSALLPKADIRPQRPTSSSLQHKQEVTHRHELLQIETKCGALPRRSNFPAGLR